MTKVKMHEIVSINSLAIAFLCGSIGIFVGGSLLLENSTIPAVAAFAIFGTPAVIFGTVGVFHLALYMMGK